VSAAKAAAAKSAFVEDAHEIDDDVLAAKVFAELRLVVHVAIFQRKTGQHQQMLVLLAIARQGRDAVTVFNQARKQARSEESGAAEYAD
jgi:hypothetical protein